MSSLQDRANVQASGLTTSDLEKLYKEFHVTTNQPPQSLESGVYGSVVMTEQVKPLFIPAFQGLSPLINTANTGSPQDMTSASDKVKRRNRQDRSLMRIRDLEVGDTLTTIIIGDGGETQVVNGTVRSCQRGTATMMIEWDHDLGNPYFIDLYDPSTLTLIRNMGEEPGSIAWDVSNIAKDIVPVEKKKKPGSVDFDTVILHKDKKKQILDTISQIDNHNLIFKEWGFEEVFEKGTAISLLFYGEPGTGKTLMGQAIADKFDYNLKVISTAEIETPEPGGAERNLKKYFDEAKSAKTVLLFDECDSLITDRQRVGMILAAQINCLLTELEKFTGIAIFTTNRLYALDPAFERRLSLKLEFPMPDAKHRELIWRRMFPSKAPLAKDIDWEGLASVSIAGGHIKNVVLKAARQTAAEGKNEISYNTLLGCLEAEVESLTNYKEALDTNRQFFGTPLPNQGRDFNRVKGKKLLG